MIAPSPPPPIVARPCSDTLQGVARRVVGPVIRWRAGAVPVGTWSVQLGDARLPVSVVVARVDPARIALELAIEKREDTMGPWTIDRAPSTAVIAVNAGQFTDAGPWGWVVHRGREWQPPGSGALAGAIVIDHARVRIVAADSIAAWRSDTTRRSTVTEAVQSYPMLLQAGKLPAALCRTGAIDRDHRDIRLAVGVRSNGEVIVALTRYAPATLPGAVAGRLPVGPTTLEMAEIMHQLGTVDAMLLDGGLSAQLRVGAGAAARSWPGLRAVPLAIIGTVRRSVREPAR